MAIPPTRHDDLTRLALPHLVRYLIDVVDAPLVAIMAQAPSMKDAEYWAIGKQAPGADAERRLRDAYRVVQTLLETDPPDVVRTWLIGMNPLLEDQAPGLVLADDPEGVLMAARLPLRTDGRLTHVLVPRTTPMVAPRHIRGIVRR